MRSGLGFDRASPFQAVEAGGCGFRVGGDTAALFAEGDRVGVLGHLGHPDFPGDLSAFLQIPDACDLVDVGAALEFVGVRRAAGTRRERVQDLRRAAVDVDVLNHEKRISLALGFVN